MSALSYITRGNSSPQGKPRVYFCCHPDDQPLFLQSISDEILALHNCAIWYDPSPAAPCDWDERQQDLSQMQLFVMPVTSRLLATPCRAMQQEFPFAIEHHIPVLPLLQEQGLEKLFNEKCGDLQFLDPYASDRTAIPYSEKLKKFLDSVLVGDELAAKVRAAFDAYIFLSYRKKDRRAAQQLMHLIHQNDFCRDIAIWYDEFLTPGENFNQAIADAMQKSSLFALVVTPSLLEHPNYVMTTEYPAARSADKPVLPVEMQATDRAELEQSYEAIPPCTPGRDAPALSAGLLEHLHRLALRENDSDPQHNYFIGLAYLSGIDVEVDHARALELIRGSAIAGYIPAIEKLVSMYRTGEGVQRNYLAAIQWQKQLVSRWKEEWEKEGSEETFKQYIDALWHLGDYYEELQNLQNWRSVWEKYVLPVCTNVWQEKKFSYARLFQAVSYNKLGDICTAEGDLKAAREFYQIMLKLFRQIAQENSTTEYRDVLSLSYNCLGRVSGAQGYLKAARNFYQLALELSSQITQEDSTFEKRRLLLVSYNNLGDTCKEEGDLKSAQEFYEMMLKLSRQLVEEAPTFEHRHALSISYDRLGNIYEAKGDFKTARQFYERMFELSQQFAQETPTIRFRYTLALAYERLGNTYATEGDIKAAHKFYNMLLKLSYQLVQEAPTFEIRHTLSTAYAHLGDIYKDEGNLEAARKSYQTTLELSRQLVQENPTAHYRYTLSIAYSDLGDVCKEEGDLCAAREFYEMQLDISRQLSQDYPTPENRQMVYLAYNDLGDVCKEEGDFKTARGFYQLALNFSHQLAQEAPTLKNHLALSIAYNNLGDMCSAQGDLKAAHEFYQLSLGLSHQIVQESPTIENRSLLSITYNGLGDVCKEEGNLKAAHEFYQLDLNLSQQLVQESPTPEAWDGLAVSWYKLGTLETISPSHLQKALEIWERLAQQYPDDPSYAQNLEIVRRKLNIPAQKPSLLRRS